MRRDVVKTGFMSGWASFTESQVLRYTSLSAH